MNLPLAISTRFSLASQGGFTQTVPEKVHALPLNRKPLSFPWIRRNLLVFLGSIFSLVSSMYILCNGIPPWNFSHSNEAAPIHFLHCCRLADFACTQPRIGSFNNSLSGSSVRPPNCKTFPCGGQQQEQLVNLAPPHCPQLHELRLHKFPLLISDKQQNRCEFFKIIR